MRKFRHIPRLKVKSELKASSSPPVIVKGFLRELAFEPDISIVAVVWSGNRKNIVDYEALYQHLVAQCAFHTVKLHKRIDLFVDKRYTNKKQQQELEKEIREAIASIPGNVVRVFQEESHVVKELTAPDFVAWAYMQRFCRSNAEYYRIIRARVVHFADLSEKATLPGHR